MILGLIKLARGAWDLAGRALGSIGDWLRKPRDWWRFTAIVAGVVCLAQAMAIMDAKREVVVVREQCAADLRVASAEAKAATALADTNAQAVRTCRTLLAQEVGNRQRVEQLARAASDAAAAANAAAQASREDWERTYQAKPPTCAAALEAMESACPTLRDY